MNGRQVVTAVEERRRIGGGVQEVGQTAAVAEVVTVDFVPVAALVLVADTCKPNFRKRGHVAVVVSGIRRLSGADEVPILREIGGANLLS